MKTVKAYISGFAAAVLLSAGFSSCQDDIDDPSVNVPVASAQANTTIADFKAAFWEDASNYAKAVGTKDDGSHYILKGRVVSSDAAGNVFRSISIQDETGALAFSINSYNLYLKYRVGQEIVIDATGMNVGKYAGLFQFGTPTYYENGETWQVGFMAPELFQSHAELNGLPKSELVDTIVVNSFTELDSSPEGLRKWQSQLVRINNVQVSQQRQRRCQQDARRCRRQQQSCRAHKRLCQFLHKDASRRIGRHRRHTQLLSEPQRFVDLAAYPE